MFDRFDFGRFEFFYRALRDRLGIGADARSYIDAQVLEIFRRHEQARAGFDAVQLEVRHPSRRVTSSLGIRLFFGFFESGRFGFFAARRDVAVCREEFFKPKPSGLRSRWRQDPDKRAYEQRE
ncbi:MAG TPA: hypothetical protein VFY36_01820 [Solirubrobacteraceae bacterium]|nr:hypothetical protein [Solirubrobacteraceae bacterium]